VSALSTWLQHPLLRDPWFLAALFLGGSLLMIWRLELMTRRGLEGTVLGTLVMPYCSGIGNLIFVFVAHAQSERIAATEIAVNCLVNNVTNMTLLIGLPAVIWATSADKENRPNRKRKVVTEQRLNRLSMLLTLLAVIFFTGTTWALGSDGLFSWTDGLVLVGLFLFWQCFHIFDVLKTNVREQRSLHWLLAVDGLLLLFGALDVYLSIQGLVDWLARHPTGFLSVQHAGWLSGWLMVLPNALLALYYGWRRKPEVLYTSQIGDGHICIPLCLGLGALLGGVPSPHMLNRAAAILAGAVLVHFVFVGLFGRLPRAAGLALCLTYAYFIYAGWV
jgi:cation:H+ antiporter